MNKSTLFPKLFKELGLFAIAIAIIMIPIIAFGLPDPFTDTSGFVAGVFAAIGEGNWRVVGAFGIIGVVALWRKYAQDRFPKLASGAGAFAIASVLGALMALAAALGGETETPVGVLAYIQVLINGAITGFTASGIYSGVKSMFDARTKETGDY